eukprot:4986364-Prymnesium_polylepis.2
MSNNDLVCSQLLNGVTQPRKRTGHTESASQLCAALSLRRRCRYISPSSTARAASYSSRPRCAR